MSFIITLTGVVFLAVLGTVAVGDENDNCVNINVGSQLATMDSRDDWVASCGGGIAGAWTRQAWIDIAISALIGAATATAPQG